MILYTIGYEATTMAEFIAALTRAGVTQVIDIRALPLSRRPGFSKSPLAASLAEAGIGYVHLKSARHAQARARCGEEGRCRDADPGL